MSRLKNCLILFILTLFLLIVKLMPVSCIFHTVTGIYCPACGMTRAFNSILKLDFISALSYNILSIPLFIFIVVSIIMLIIDIIKNKFEYIPNVLKFLSKHYVSILILLFISFLFNNLNLFL